MANKMISEILKTVKEADEIVAKANDEKDKLISDATLESMKQALKIIEDARLTASETISSKEKEAEEISNLKVEKTKEKLKSFNINSFDKKDINKAVDYIVKKVIEDGNS